MPKSVITKCSATGEVLQYPREFYSVEGKLWCSVPPIPPEHAPAPVFGKVVEGMEVVRKIEELDGTPPKQKVTIRDSGELPLPQTLQ